MSVPHLGTRMINGGNPHLFGSYALFSPKYLKSGSNFDSFKSVKYDNLNPMFAAGRDNMPLTKYPTNGMRLCGHPIDRGYTVFSRVAFQRVGVQLGASDCCMVGRASRIARR